MNKPESTPSDPDRELTLREELKRRGIESTGDERIRKREESRARNARAAAGRAKRQR